MKKAFLILLAVVLALSMVALACPAPAEQQEEEEEEEEERTVITLDFGTFWPPVDFQVGGAGSPYPGTGHYAWMSQISEEVLADTTDYQIEWRVHHKHPVLDLWPGVTATPATYDVITSGPGYTAGVMPLWAGPEFASELPGRTDALAMSMAYQKLYDDYAPAKAEIEDQVKLMHLWSTGPGFFLMTPDWGPITSMGDFTDAKIRAANPASAAIIAALGAEVYSVAMSGAYEAFEAGLVDGILCPTDTPVGFGLDEFLRSAAYAPSSYQFVFMKVMSKSTWDGLPASVQAVFDKVNAEYPEYYGKLRQWGEEGGLAYCEATYGADWTTVDLPNDYPAVYAELTAIGEGTREAWIGGDADKQAMWDAFVAADAWAAANYGGTFTPGATPPPPPAF
ncbi:MAG: hypothetical protein R6V59_02185 [Dehalococcoidia bacterium]